MRVLIADDSALIRDGLSRLLPSHGLEVADAVADAPSLLQSIEAKRPDVALIDIRMPPTYTSEGLDAAATIRSRESLSHTSKTLTPAPNRKAPRH